jgi:hypothetical protein
MTLRSRLVLGLLTMLVLFVITAQASFGSTVLTHSPPQGGVTCVVTLPPWAGEPIDLALACVGQGSTTMYVEGYAVLPSSSAGSFRLVGITITETFVTPFAEPARQLQIANFRPSVPLPVDLSLVSAIRTEQAATGTSVAGYSPPNVRLSGDTSAGLSVTLSKFQQAHTPNRTRYGPIPVYVAKAVFNEVIANPFRAAAPLRS